MKLRIHPNKQFSLNRARRLKDPLIRRESNHPPSGRACGVMPFYESFAAAVRACLSFVGLSRVLWISGVILVISAIFCPPAHAIVPVGGWGYSIGYAADRIIGVITPEDDLWSIWIDPPPELLTDGRVTLHYDPSLFTVKNYGWVGSFGADPSIPAPPVTADGIIPVLAPDSKPWVLQSPNAGLVNSSVTIDPLIGEIVVEFDWGLSGFQPATADHFNFFGISLSIPENLKGFEYVPRGNGDFGLLGSAADVAANGKAAVTYLACSGGYCGDEPKGDLRAVFVPETSSTGVLLLLGIAGLLTFNRGRSSTSRVGKG